MQCVLAPRIAPCSSRGSGACKVCWVHCMSARQHSPPPPQAPHVVSQSRAGGGLCICPKATGSTSTHTLGATFQEGSAPGWSAGQAVQRFDRSWSHLKASQRNPIELRLTAQAPPPGGSAYLPEAGLQLHQTHSHRRVGACLCACFS